MIALGSFAESFVGLRHALAFAAELRAECVVGGKAAKNMAMVLGLDKEQTAGAVRLLRAHPTLSPERAALVVMLDPGMEDEDIAEIFGRSIRWARIVREQAAEIKAEEPIDPQLEYLDSGLELGDPTPEQIHAMAAELRGNRQSRSAVTVPSYQWSAHAFVPVITR